MLCLGKGRLILSLSSEGLQTNVFDTETAEGAGSDAENYFSLFPL